MRLAAYLILLMLFGCQAEPQFVRVETPEDTTIESAVEQAYINRVYVALLGREPMAEERSFASDLLRSNAHSIEARKRLLNELFAQAEYHEQCYAQARSDYLNFIFSPEALPETIEIWEALPKTEENEAELKRLRYMQQIPSDLQSGTLSERGLQRVLVHNSFYDFVNMGTENFVNSIFENFLARFPTGFELEEGKKMVEGMKGSLFFLQGSSKSEFLDIILNSDPYYEGQVCLLYQRHLYRAPSSEEMVDLAARFKEAGHWRFLLTEILSSDEYFGI